MNTKRYYFFSDVHLGLKSREIENEKEKKLVSFLDEIAPSAKAIFIVGDLFDCWIEYRKVVPKGYFKLLAKLNQIVESGIPVHFLSGNHDFWLNTYLSEDVGLTVHYEPLQITLEGKKFYLTHGDGLGKKDIGYKILKKILRSRFNQFLYSLIHPDIGVAIAQRSSRKSREAVPEIRLGPAAGMREFANKMINSGFDYVIMGHFHKPTLMSLNGSGTKGTFITLGDWIKHYSYGVFENGAFRMDYYN